MIQREQIVAARKAIAPHIRQTPVLEVPPGTLGIDATLVLKLEHMQTSGSFKVRGVMNNVLTHPGAAKSGLVAASGGNHGIAVALVARRLGVQARVFLPTLSGAAKRGRLRDLGAEVLVDGEIYQETLAAARRMLRRRACSFFTRSKLLRQSSERGPSAPNSKSKPSRT